MQDQLLDVAAHLHERDADPRSVGPARRHHPREARDRLDHQLAGHLEVHADDVADAGERDLLAADEHPALREVHPDPDPDPTSTPTGPTSATSSPSAPTR